MNKVKDFIQTAGVYFIGNVLSKLIAFFLLPLYTNYLSPDILGEYDYAATLISFFSPICFFQIWDAMFRFSFDFTDEETKNKVISNSFIVSVAGIGIYMIVFGIINAFVHFRFSLLVLIYGMFISINYQYSYLARVYRRNALFSISGFLNSVVVAVTNIILILHFNCGLKSLYIASMMGAIVQCFIIELYLKPNRVISFKSFDKKLIKMMIKFSLPLCVATVSYWFLSGLSKIIIVKMLGSYENGLYAVTNKFAMFLNIAVSIFQFAWNEMAYVANKETNRNVMYAVAVKYIVQFVFVSACELIILSKLVFPFVIGEAYQDAVIYMPATIIGAALNSIAGFLGTIFSTEKKTKYIFLTTVIAACINCILGPIFTVLLGLQGAIVVLAMSFGILMIGRLLFLRFRLRVEFEKQGFSAVVLILATIGVFYLFNNVIINLLFAVLICICELLIIREIIVDLKND